MKFLLESIWFIVLILLRSLSIDLFIPNDAIVKIKVYFKSSGNFKTFIGETIIDIEDRFLFECFFGSGIQRVYSV